ncbi:MAG: hypothetical protein ACREJ3_11690, partial [Polyangiaceae bacterium]
MGAREVMFTSMQPAPSTGGASRPRVGESAPAGGASVFEDPMTRVFGLGAQTSALTWLGYYVAAVALLVLLSVLAHGVTLLIATTDVAPPEVAPIEIEMVRDEPPPPPPAPVAEAAPKAPAPPPPAKAPPKQEPPPAPAQAGKVLTQEPDPNDPVDLTGDSIVTGNALAYAGGVTAANGTSTTAVRNLTSPAIKPAATGGSRPAAPGPDRSRKASIGGQEWDIPFPPEADAAQIDDAYVTMRISVGADGSVTAAVVLADPGYGFGREAR